MCERRENGLPNLTLYNKQVFKMASEGVKNTYTQREGGSEKEVQACARL